jgi:hypothetical protein
MAPAKKICNHGAAEPACLIGHIRQSRVLRSKARRSSVVTLEGLLGADGFATRKRRAIYVGMAERESLSFRSDEDQKSPFLLTDSIFYPQGMSGTVPFRPTKSKNFCGMDRGMKSPRRHPQKALTSIRINSLSVPGRYGDGNGLYLVVDPSGAKRWVLRTVVQGIRRDIGLGGLRLVSLAEARVKAHEYRGLARDGGNPIEARRRAKATVPTFAEAALSTLEQRRAGWKDVKHPSQWINTLKAYVFPVMGEKRVDQIETADVLRSLSPIWLSKPETARRVRQRMAIVLDWAKAAGYRNGDNPVEGVGRGLPRQSEKRGHFAAIPYANVPNFVQKLSPMSRYQR